MRHLHRLTAISPVLLAALMIPALYGSWQSTAAAHEPSGEARSVHGAGEAMARARDDDYSRGFRDGYVLGMRDGYDKCGHMQMMMHSMPPMPMPTPMPTATPMPTHEQSHGGQRSAVLQDDYSQGFADGYKSGFTDICSPKPDPPLARSRAVPPR